MKQTHKRTLYMCVTLLWVFVIFSFSLQNGEESGQLSGGIVSWVVETFSLTRFMELDTIHFLIRKMAHFTEYFILGMFTVLTLLQTQFSKKCMIGTLFCVIIASFDETIQLFVGGRAGQLKDVLLDSTGALCGILFLFLCRFILYDIIPNWYLAKSKSY